MSFSISHISNDKLNVKVKESLGSSFFNMTRTATFVPGESFVVVNFTEPVIIDSIDWFPRNETKAEISIDVLGGGSDFINELGTGVTSSISPSLILNGLSLYWDVVKYDTTVTPDPIIRFHLKDPIYCPAGVSITVRNTDTALTFRNSIQVRGRKLS